MFPFWMFYFINFSDVYFNTILSKIQYYKKLIKTKKFINKLILLFYKYKKIS